MPQDTFLETERLIFTKWTEDDLVDARRLWGNPNIMRYITKAPYTDEQILDVLNKQVTRDKETGLQYWKLHQKSDNDFAGCCGFRMYDEEKKILELGYHIAEEHWGKGFATEAGRRAVEYAFTLPINKIFAAHHPENLASQNVLEKLGFKFSHMEYYEPTEVYDRAYFLTSSEVVK
ncbi:MAG TPA: GNAT family N-acetyltransferase [Ignavibacteria bacterium]|nr:GNAT family N-acetyltransferase [Ignavibacteria bacterium]